jgi:hypothetical protein
MVPDGVLGIQDSIMATFAIEENTIRKSINVTISKGFSVYTRQIE